MSPDDIRSALVEALEQFKDMTSIITGLRNDLIGQGWSPQSAEEIALAAWRKMLGQ